MNPGDADVASIRGQGPDQMWNERMRIPKNSLISGPSEEASERASAECARKRRFFATRAGMGHCGCAEDKWVLAGEREGEREGAGGGLIAAPGGTLLQELTLKEDE